MTLRTLLDPHRGCRRALTALVDVITSERTRHRAATADALTAAADLAKLWLDERAQAYRNDAGTAAPARQPVCIAVAAELRQAGIDVQHLTRPRT